MRVISPQRRFEYLPLPFGFALALLDMHVNVSPLTWSRKVKDSNVLGGRQSRGDQNYLFIDGKVHLDFNLGIIRMKLTL